MLSLKPAPHRIATAARRLRAAHGLAGGASSLLRLSSAPRLPRAEALGRWIGRAARALASSTQGAV
jgi:hypothetical protein